MADILTLATASLPSDWHTGFANQQYHRIDYLELQKNLGVEVLDYTTYDHFLGGMLHKIETQIHSDPYLALIGLRQRARHRLVFAMSERAGIPYAFLNRTLPRRKPFVTMFQCWSDRQEKFIKTFNLFSAMDGVAVHCQSMKQHLVSQGLAEEKTHILPYGIDHHFFQPNSHIAPEKNLVVAIGESRSRDYAALFQATTGLPIQLEVAAAGMWFAREKNNGFKASLPENAAIISPMTPVRLRNWYARAQFVVLPVRDLLYSAGATSSMEAGSMGKAVIAFRSRGIVDFIIDGETGILVPPGDIAGLREAIAFLLANPQEAKRLGENARQRIQEEINIDIYVKKMADFITIYLPRSQALIS